MNLIRLWEKVTGTPHKQILAEQVLSTAADLKTAADELKTKLECYKKHPDPFTAIMADLYEQRQEAHLHKGTPR